MRPGILSLLFSALLGGVVGGIVVSCMNDQTTQAEPPKVELTESRKFDSLEVKNLIITNRAVLQDAEGKEAVVIKEGSVLADNVVLGRKFIGQQYQGHVFVGNRMFTTPDNLVATPMERWNFFTEIGSTKDTGGEIIVRSPDGSNITNQSVEKGSQWRVGFDQQAKPQLFVKTNMDGKKQIVSLVEEKSEP